MDYSGGRLHLRDLESYVDTRGTTRFFALKQNPRCPGRNKWGSVVHAWAVTTSDSRPGGSAPFESSYGFNGFLYSTITPKTGNIGGRNWPGGGLVP